LHLKGVRGENTKGLLVRKKEQRGSMKGGGRDQSDQTGGQKKLSRHKKTAEITLIRGKVLAGERN